MCGGAALEKAAEKGDPLAFTFPLTLLQYRDCNFSFGGLTNRLHKIVISDEKKFGKFNFLDGLKLHILYYSMSIQIYSDLQKQRNNNILNGKCVWYKANTDFLQYMVAL